jgi:hypothetical protein
MLPPPYQHIFSNAHTFHAIGSTRASPQEEGYFTYCNSRPTIRHASPPRYRIKLSFFPRQPSASTPRPSGHGATTTRHRTAQYFTALIIHSSKRLGFDHFNISIHSSFPRYRRLATSIHAASAARRNIIMRPSQ